VVCVSSPTRSTGRVRASAFNCFGEASAVTEHWGKGSGALARLMRSPSICAACAEADTHTTWRATECRHGTRSLQAKQPRIAALEVVVAPDGDVEQLKLCL